MISKALAQISGHGSLLNFFRFFIAFIVLLLPSIAMGMTIPLLQKFLHAHEKNFSKSLGTLYGVNTLGACKANGYQLPQFWFKQGAKSASARRGPREKYDWEEFQYKVTWIANQPDGLPEKQVELEKMMAQWCVDQWGHEPSVSMIREKVAPNYRKAHKGR